MSQSSLVYSWWLSFCDLIVLMNFQGRAIIIITGEPQMYTLKFRTAQACSFFQPIPGLFPFGGNRNTVENFNIKVSKLEYLGIQNLYHERLSYCVRQGCRIEAPS